MWYELWHVESANLMDDFANEADALAAARAYLTPNARGETVDVALVVRDDRERPIRSIEGEELVRLAFGQTGGEMSRTA